MNDDNSPNKLSSSIQNKTYNQLLNSNSISIHNPQIINLQDEQSPFYVSPQAVSDFTNQNIQNINQKEQQVKQSGIQHLFQPEKHFDTFHKKQFQIKIDYKENIFKQLLLPLLTIMSTTMCIVNLISWQECRISDCTGNSNRIIDYIVASTFLLQLIMQNKNTKNNYYRAEQVLNVFIIIEMYWTASSQSRNKIVILLHTLRSIKILTLKHIFGELYDDVILMFKKRKTNQNQIIDWSAKLRKFLLKEIINFMSGIFMEATLLLAIDEVSGYRAYSTPQNIKLDYVSMFYFVVVSFSTIGYGDIYPVLNYSRLTQCVLIIINLTILLKFLTLFIQKFEGLSMFDRPYKYRDHIIIIGQLQEKEICEILNNIGTQDLKYRLFTGVNPTQILIVLNFDPSISTQEYANKIQFEKGCQIDFLSINIFYDESNHWMSKSNISTATHLLAFTSQNNAKEISLDFQLYQLIKQCSDQYPKLKIKFYIQNQALNNYNQVGNFERIQIVVPQLINQSILVQCLENQGFSIFLQHIVSANDFDKQILNLKSKQVKKLSHYSDGLLQNIISFKCPKFFVGMLFQKAAELMYYHSLQIGEQENSIDYMSERNVTLIGIQTIPINERKKRKFSNKKQDDQNERTPLNLWSSIPTESQEGKNSIYLINPQNYRLKETDILYLICDDETKIENIIDLQSKQNFEYQNYERIIKSIENSLPCQNIRDDLLNEMYASLFEKYNQTQTESDSNFLDVSLEQDIESYKYFNFNNNQYLKKIPKYHYLIFGVLIDPFEMINKLRKYSDRQIVIFSQKVMEINQIKQNIQGVTLITGSYLNIFHLEKLGVANAYSIIILNDNESNLNQSHICLTKILREIFNIQNSIVEIADIQQTQYFDMPSQHNVYLLSENFANGNLFHSSTPLHIFTKGIFYPGMTEFLLNFACTELNQKQNAQLQGLNQYFQNRNIHTLQLTEIAATTLQYYGILFYTCLNHQPTLIPIYLIKKQKLSIKDHLIIDKSARKLIEQIFFKEQSQEYAKNNESKLKILQKEIAQLYEQTIGNQQILSNPSFFTKIESGDQIVMLGETHCRPQRKKQTWKQNNESSQGKAEFSQFDSISMQGVIQPVKNQQKNILQKELQKKQLLCKIMKEKLNSLKLIQAYQQQI